MEKIQIEVLINKDIKEVWDKLTLPQHMTQWTFASDDWHCPSASNDLRVGGTMSSRMEAKDGSFGFDFAGVYTEVAPLKSYAYVLGDKREVSVELSETVDGVKVVEIFDPESENPAEMQRAGWQAILDNFKKYCEGSK